MRRLTAGERALRKLVTMATEAGIRAQDLEAMIREAKLDEADRLVTFGLEACLQWLITQEGAPWVEVLLVDLAHMLEENR